MVKKLLLFILLLSASAIFAQSPSQCNYSFVMSDAFGDGWNGNTMSVRQNGILVATIGAAFTSGAGPVTVSLPLEDGASFELFWNAGGTFANEVRVSIMGSNGQTIYTKPSGTGLQNSLLYSGIVNCNPPPACLDPTSLVISNITQTTSKISWANTSGATQWEVLVLPANSPAPTVNQSGTVVSTNSFVFTGLICATSYRAYVKTVCNATSSSSWIASPANFTTLLCDLPFSGTCAGANSLCGAFGTSFPNTRGVGNQGAMGCLATTPNPAWFYFSVDSPGLINLQIMQSTLVDVPSGNLDVDYVIYGPYTETVTPCNGQLTPDKIVSCSYSANAVEYPSFTASQAGQFYYLMVTNFSNQAGYIKITDLPTTQASLDCSGFRLNTFLDSNSNGVKDAGEQIFPQGQFLYEKNNDGIQHNVLSSTGQLNIYEDNPSNSYDLGFELNPDYAAYYNVTTPSYNDVSATGAGMSVYNFPVAITTPYNDVSVTIIPIDQPRPGFSHKNKIVYTNNGNQTIATGTVSFTKDAVLTITNNSQSGTVSTSNGFTYGFTDLLPFETRSMIVTMAVPTIPTVALGNHLNNAATVSTLSGGDVIAENNTFNLSEIVVGSYDPNDIMESRGEEILHSGFSSDDYLYYTVRFENTGTASAINVKVNDVLDPKLDETTIKMVSSSHNYIMDRVGVNINWDFKNIGLTATMQNPNTSTGYITYKIKPKAGYAVGDIIPNTAFIYFDYNPAIVTNTFNTEFVSQLSVDEFENTAFVFYPNPVKDILTIAAKENNSISEIVIYDISGKQILKRKMTGSMNPETIDLSVFSRGVYLLEVSTNTNAKTIKKLLIE